jgi:hypothetical protein
MKKRNKLEGVCYLFAIFWSLIAIFWWSYNPAFMAVLWMILGELEGLSNRESK